MSLQELKKYTFRAKYSSYNPEKKRRETWIECVSRSESMMLRKYADKNIGEIIKEAYSAAKRKEVLGAQRALQFAGPAIEAKNARLYNCLHQDTKFITKNGVKSFNDFNDGDETIVLTHTGDWKKAIVKNHGYQNLNKISFKRKNNEFSVLATDNHRWLLSNNQFTESLSIDDKLIDSPDIFSNFDYNNCTPLEKLYWCYGYVYGDGTLIKNGEKYTHSMVRLCDHDRKYKYRFEEMGFVTSSSQSLNGDFIAYTGTYLKTSPNPEIDSPELIRAFVRGYLDADGEKNKNNTKNKFLSIQSSDIKHIEFIKKCFPIAGVYIVSETELTGQITNFGIRPYTILFKINNNIEGSSAGYFTVTNIEKNTAYEEVWCLEVEDNHTFILDNGLVTGNCSSTYADRPRFFQEAMYLLLCGCGVGFSVQTHHIARLPKLVKELEGRAKFSIPDTIEGWSDAIGILVNSYLRNGLYPDYEGKIVDFDYSKIRPAGSKLSYTTGKAPGPEPLKNAVAKIRKLLNEAISNKQTKLKPIQVYDIVMHSSDAVLAGGVRRSATICLFSPEDEEMLTAKTGNWFNENPQRGRSNNSVVLLRDETTKEQFENIIRKVKDCGEPGFVWVDSLESNFNPCVEINFWCYNILDKNKLKKYQEKYGYKQILDLDEAGVESGWEFCNLSTINGAKAKTKEIFLEACKQAAIIGTLQAGFTNFEYLTEATSKIVEREALLGVSITGVMENPDICLNEEIQRAGAQIIIETNKEIAKLIGINQAARTTCIKPEGTTSCILGTSSGIHPHHAKRYIRRVQATKLEPLYQYFKNINPAACEESVWSANDSDDIISFCIPVPDGAKTKNQLKAVELLDYVKNTQKNWVTYGKVEELCTQKWLNHNVSNTITVRETEWEEVGDFIYKNRQYFCGISLLPESGDKDYPQAPFTTIYTPKEMIGHYGDGAMFVSGLIERSLDLFDDNLWKACDTLNGVDGKISGASKKDWYARCKTFADKYLGGDLKKLTYLMKDVYNWKKWLDLNRLYKDVDYDAFLENADEVNINHQADSACAGPNGCSIIRT